MFKTIDLFAGIGGIRRGFEKTGKFKNIISAEIDRYACITYNHLYKEDPYNDVTSEEFKEKVDKIDYDVLLAGFPCQAFSIAGKKEGFEDKTRGTLFFDVADIISRTKPKAFLLENVEGLLTHKKGETFKTILEVLIKDLGYKIVGTNEVGEEIIFERKSFLRSCKNFGLPQKRTRTYIVGFRKDLIPENYNFDELPDKKTDIKLYRDLNDLLELRNDEKYYMSSGGLETLKNHKKSHSEKGNGFGYEVINDPSIKNPIANTILATGGSGKERNLVYDPQEGIAGKVIKGKKTPLNDEGIRVMTPKEWGKLQGFINYAFVNEKGEDEFTFPEGISDNQLYKQFGNSVAIPVIEEIAKYIYNNLVNILGGEMSKHKKSELTKYNKGEWSEVYTFLKCLSESKFLVKDSNLENILAQYNIIEIYKKEYKGERELIFKPTEIDKDKYLEVAQKVFEEIQISENTTFEIPFLEEFAEQNNFSLSKGKSKVKSDLDAKIEDELKNQSKRLEYSIKSQLASPSTLLNASTHTNFLYKIENIELEDVEEINNIDTKNKLKDKIEAIYKKGYKIKGLGAESKEFKYNLNLLDGDLQEILSFILLYSYKYSIKNLNDLIKKLVEKNPLDCPVNNTFFYKEKLGRFLMEVTASMTPGTKVTSLKASDNSFGGILLVEKRGEISLLDNIHYKTELKNYLNKNLKLDSPSSTRYDMLNLKYDDNKKEAIFSLNLQIRFIK